MKPKGRPPAQPTILYRDDCLLVVDKPANLFQTYQSEQPSGVPNLLAGKNGLPVDEPFFVTHRVHEQASGTVVYARTAEYAEVLQRQFEAGTAESIYLALVAGYVAADGEIHMPLFYDKRAGRCAAGHRNGVPASTSYRILQRIAGNTLLECRPQRESYDQVRAHLAAIGHPLTVDPAFGGGYRILLSEYKSHYRVSTRHEERPLIERLTLHCRKVDLEHPVTGERMSFEAPLPKDLSAVLTQLGRLQ